LTRLDPIAVKMAAGELAFGADLPRDRQLAKYGVPVIGP
jgi:hypothetical protein